MINLLYFFIDIIHLCVFSVHIIYNQESGQKTSQVKSKSWFGMNAALRDLLKFWTIQEEAMKALAAHTATPKRWLMRFFFAKNRFWIFLSVSLSLSLSLSLSIIIFLSLHTQFWHATLAATRQTMMLLRKRETLRKKKSVKPSSPATNLSSTICSTRKVLHWWCVGLWKITSWKQWPKSYLK